MITLTELIKLIIQNTIEKEYKKCFSTVTVSDDNHRFTIEELGITIEYPEDI